MRPNDIVQEIVHWYTEQIAAERRAPLPDEERLAQLTAGRTAAYQDLQRLEDADPEEDRLAVLYAARLRDLESWTVRGRGQPSYVRAVSGDPHTWSGRRGGSPSPR
ncbi:hypothetical protein [Streptomyces sp. DSM 15324]|uniref:hypothetical protein n=1 Tax=Streptomyces sp. DSM 15324 TaxID=1739111 RepID=UPI00082D215E|nr:hypothetical protein [Streptomyces sp. DSM 15324]